MIRFLENVRSGLLEPNCLLYAESTRRAHSMELSKYRDVAQDQSSGVNTLDIEMIDGRYMLSGGADGTIVIHDLENLTGKPEYTCKTIHKIGRNYPRSHKYSVETVQWYPLDTGMFTSSDLEGLLKLWDTNTLKRVGEFKLSHRIYQHHMSPIATVHNLIAVGRTTSHVTLVDLKTGSCTHELRGHSDMVMCVRWSPGHEYLLASGSCDNSLLLWDIRSPKSALHRFDSHNKSNVSRRTSIAHNGRVNGLCFTHDGLHLLSYGTDDHLYVWDMCTGGMETINFGKIENESRKTIKIDVSRNSTPEVVFVPCKGRICVYELENGTAVNKLIGHYNVVNCCLYHPFHHELYSGANDHNILVWSPDKEQADAYSDFLHCKDQNDISPTNTFNRKITTTDTWSDED